MRVLLERVDAVREKQTDELHLEGNVVDADALPLLHGDVQRVVALGVGEVLEVVGGARVDEGLAGLQVQPLDRLEEGRVALGGEVG